MSRKQFLKVSKRSIVIGLIGLVAVVVTLLTIGKKRKWNLWNRFVVLLSPYRKLSPYLVAMSKVETADLTSPVYNTNNNLFGMKGATKRPQLGTPGTVAPDGGKYQAYSTDTQSIRDWFLWADYVNFPKAVSNASQFNDELQKRSYYGIAPQKYLELLNSYL